MTIQDRFTLYMIPVLMIAFGTVLSTVFLLPAQIDNQINNELNALAISIAENDLEWPEEVSPFKTGSTFFVVTNKLGEVISQSNNFPSNVTYLDAAGLFSWPEGDLDGHLIRDVTYDGQTLRVITYAFTTGNTGFLQIGRLVNDYEIYRNLETATVYIIASSFFGALAAVGFIMPRILRHLSRITDVAEQITSADDLSLRIDEPTARDDITILVRVLNRLMERLERLFRTQQRLVGDVSHELRTPLTAIRGNIDLIRRTGEADPESLAAIDSESKRMVGLVDDLLTLARADVNGLPLENQPFALDRLVLEVYEQMLMLGSPVQVHLGTLDQVEIVGDPNRLKQLLINLMTNGMKYTDPGGWTKISLTQEQGLAVLRIADSGLGISAEDLPNIFDRFYRVNKARSRERGGSGLGLAIVKSIVDAHEGEIFVESEFGVGSTFTVRLPITK